MLPKKLGEVLRIVSPRKNAGKPQQSSNRFHALRSKSRSHSRNRNRSRSHSARNDHHQNPPSENANSGENSAQKNTDEKQAKRYNITLDEDTLSRYKVELEYIASTCEQVEKGIPKVEAGNDLKELLAGIGQMLKSFGRIQSALISSAKPVEEAPLSYANVAKKMPNNNAQNGDNNTGRNSRNNTTHKQQQQPVGRYATYDSEDMREKDRKYYRFKDTIRDAERATLVFNLNLGRVPIMDYDTMSTRATLALSKKAAIVEKSDADRPSEDTRESLDDALGMATGIQFYGRQTKTYRNPKDAQNSGAYCTLPVRYDFRDRDTRIRVEKILRERCDANVSTPYPLVVRECIKRVAAATKVAYPDASVRVNVDAHNFCLRVGIKEKNADKFNWIKKPVPLPVSALDTELKQLPRDFEFEITLIPGEKRDVAPAAIEINATPMEGDVGPPQQ